MKQMKYILITSALAALVAGCASNGYQQANSTAAYLNTAADRVDKSATQIETATNALSALVNRPQGDLKLQFNTFSTAVNKLESLANSVGAGATRVQQMGAAYFQKWDEQLAMIQNEDIRNNSAERKASVMKQFDQAKASYDATRAAFNPLLADLRDIRTAISTDLTPAGTGAIRKSMDKVVAEAGTVHKSLTDLSAQFKGLAKSLEVPTPPPATK